MDTLPLNVESIASSFVDALDAYGREHRAQHWEGSFGDFLAKVLPENPAALARVFVGGVTLLAALLSFVPEILKKYA